MPSPGWFNENSNRAYPFVAGTVGREPDGPTHTGNLADDLVVDAGFVAGPRSGFESGVHGVYLARVRRSAGFFYLDFESDAPGLYSATLTFSRPVGGADFAVEFVDSGEAGLSASSSSASDSTATAGCDDPLWSGFLVTGSAAALELLLPGDGDISRGPSASVVEPALIQNLAGAVVTKFGLANDDRTRTEAAEGCDGGFPFETGVTRVRAACVVGDVVFTAGYNAVVRQTPGDNSITFGASVGAGAGQPCDSVSLFPGESPPDGSSLLEGGPRCNETLRSINGTGGPQFNIVAGRGATVTSVPEANKIVVAIDMTGLALCYSDISSRSESC